MLLKVTTKKNVNKREIKAMMSRMVPAGSRDGQFICTGMEKSESHKVTCQTEFHLHLPNVQV